VVLTAAMTWPQALVLDTHARLDQDVFFNLWRLGWFAHALATSPASLFDANIFHPERGVLAYSDAILVEGLIAAPLLWAGVPPVLVHNLLLLGAIVASGVGMTLLARYLTGSLAGGVIAGIIFSFAPYRFDHYHHLELQWTIWMPWTLWALQRLLDTGSLRFGALAGLFAGLQIASGVYYGIFLSLLIVPVAVVQLVPRRGMALRRSVAGLAVAAVVLASLTMLYYQPYSNAAERVGTRTTADATTFSARPGDYLQATPDNLLYGWLSTSWPERRLFPGLTAAVLALVGLLLTRRTAAPIAFAIGLAFAFELSLGFFGVGYPLLHGVIGVLHGLRAPARAGVFVLLFLGVLAAYGTAALTASWSAAARRGAAVLIGALTLLEYWVAPLDLAAFHNQPPPLYAFVARLPSGPVAEFPMPDPKSPPHHDPRFAYMSTFHWKPLINGYSGFYPPSYEQRLRALETFPDARALDTLRQAGVRYVIVHDDGYPPGERLRLVEQLVASGLRPLGTFEDGWSAGSVLELIPGHD
jgi:hypothetical protein